MNRRRFLAALGAAGALSGCVSPAADPGPDPGCLPSPDPSVGSVRCGSDPRAGIRVTRSAAALAAPRDALWTTLHSGTDRDRPLAVEGVRLYRRHDGGWSLLSKRVRRGLPRGSTVPPGGEARFRVGVDNAALGTPGVRARDVSEWEFVFRLPPGVYAAGFEVETPGGDGREGSDAASETASEPDARVFARRFEVTGDPLGLVPTRGVDRVARRGDTLVVRAWTDRDDPGDRPVSLVADRLPSIPETATRLTTFELYNPGFREVRDPAEPTVEGHVAALLRDGFAHYDGTAERIRVETVGGARRPPDVEPDPTTVVHGPTAWRIERETAWSDLRAGRRTG